MKSKICTTKLYWMNPVDFVEIQDVVIVAVRAMMRWQKERLIYS
jgi:hypothetical protein